ncbi:AAA family ATPase [Microcoleus sp. A003_D6]|uniref:AAA family ATPase n=1 Tax=Microcoleus sp. A003_D6 TaxID=3055266 RepID=UPI002FCF02A2
MELVILMGLQASGKSTFFRDYLAATHVLVSKDLMRNNKNKSRRQIQLIENALKAGHSVAVDNTNPEVLDRRPLIDIGRTYNAQIIGYYLESTVSDCLARNQKRSGKSQVPDIAIYATLKKMVVPSYGEGFDRLFFARLSDNFTFEVKTLPAEEVIHGQSNI